MADSSNNILSLRNKVAVVTGGSDGIGREIVLTFTRQGANVVFTYLSNEEKALQLVSEVAGRGLPGKAKAVKTDVSVEKDVKRLFDSAEEAFGHIHIVVNNAGVNLHWRGTGPESYPPLVNTSGRMGPRIQCEYARHVHVLQRRRVTDTLERGWQDSQYHHHHCGGQYARVQLLRGEQSGCGKLHQDPGQGAPGQADYRQLRGPRARGDGVFLPRQKQGDDRTTKLRSAARTHCPAQRNC